MNGLDHLDELARVKDELAEWKRSAIARERENKQLKVVNERCVKEISKYRAAARIFRGFLNDQLEDVD